jgi:hypothetical protein
LSASSKLVCGVPVARRARGVMMADTGVFSSSMYHMSRLVTMPTRMPLIVHNGETADAFFVHEALKLAEARLRRDAVRILDDGVFGALHTGHLLGLGSMGMFR